MMTRRDFLVATAAGAAMFARIPNALAAKYDLIIKDGRVIDPSLGIDSNSDVAITGGRIAAVEPNIAASDGAEILNARGKLVVPGMIDIHSHGARAKELPPLSLADGVTAFVDAGSMGADRIDEVVA